MTIHHSITQLVMKLNANRDKFLPPTMSYPLRRMGTNNVQRRIMVHPHKIFTEAFAPPPSPPIFGRMPPTRKSIFELMYWKEAKTNQLIALRSQEQTQDVLSSSHRDKILQWPRVGIMFQNTDFRTKIFLPQVQNLLALMQHVLHFVGSLLPISSRISARFQSPRPIVPRQSIEWKESAKDQLFLSRSLDRMQDALRSVHKHKISWPDGGSLSRYVFLHIAILILA